MTAQDSECAAQYDGGELVGFFMGYYKEYDDLRAYFLEEIVVFAGRQNHGYGTVMLAELERRARQNGAGHIELLSVNDAHHRHFYEKAGFYAASNLLVMDKHF